MRNILGMRAKLWKEGAQGCCSDRVGVGCIWFTWADSRFPFSLGMPNPLICLLFISLPLPSPNTRGVVITTNWGASFPAQPFHCPLPPLPCAGDVSGVIAYLCSFCLDPWCALESSPSGMPLTFSWSLLWLKKNYSVALGKKYLTHLIKSPKRLRWIFFFLLLEQHLPISLIFLLIIFILTRIHLTCYGSKKTEHRPRK